MDAEQAGDRVESLVPINLGAHQRAIMAELQQDQGRLAQLDQERAALIARIYANRGKLNLIAELAQPVMTSGEA